MDDFVKLSARNFVTKLAQMLWLVVGHFWKLGLLLSEIWSHCKVYGISTIVDSYLHYKLQTFKIWINIFINKPNRSLASKIKIEIFYYVGWRRIIYDRITPIILSNDLLQIDTGKHNLTKQASRILLIIIIHLRLFGIHFPHPYGTSKL